MTVSKTSEVGEEGVAKSKPKRKKAATKKPSGSGGDSKQARKSARLKKVLKISGVRGIFRAKDDTPLYFEVEGQGPALILCYGLVCRREHWNHQVEYFKKTHTVVTFDYRGHQSSSSPKNDRNLTLDWCAEDVVSLMDHLELESAIVFGHSLGVPIVLKAALKDSRISRIALICGSVSNPFEHMFYTNRMNRVYQAAQIVHDWAPSVGNQIWEWFTRINPVNYFITSQLGFHPNAATERDILSYMKGVNQTPFDVFQTLMKDYADYDGREDLKRAKLPMLLVGGEDDLITPCYLLEEMAALAPNAELKIIPQASHNAHSDFPEEINEMLERFIHQKVGKS